MSKTSAQFQFNGHVNEQFKNSTAYLNLIDDFAKSNLFITEQIIQSSSIDSLGFFNFEGNFLNSKKAVYKIYLDNCHDNIGDSKHLLNQCEESISIIFIANNKDQIHFPLNDLSQMFCSIDDSNRHNLALFKLDSIQEELLVDLPDSKSDLQRNMIYKDYFNKLKSFSITLEEPLAELYAFHQYSKDESFSRKHYLNDLKDSPYYNELLEKLKQNYPNSSLTNNFKIELTRDQYPLMESENTKKESLLYVLSALLFISILLNSFFIVRNRTYSRLEKKNKLADYKNVLSTQEQKVFELIQERLTNKEIADKLFISLSTVKTHINNIYSKLSISSRKEIHHFI